MATLVFLAATAAVAAGCRGERVIGQGESAVGENDWVGVYASPSEIGGFSKTVLIVERNPGGDGLGYRMRFQSDVVSDDEIQQDVLRGTVLSEGGKLYVPEASGDYMEGKPFLFAHLTRYTRCRINAHIALLRDDALRAYERDDELYDYGILIRVADKADWQTDFDGVKHPSIRLLYGDKRRGWKDPFVHGPNQR